MTVSNPLSMGKHDRLRQSLEARYQRTDRITSGRDDIRVHILQPAHIPSGMEDVPGWTDGQVISLNDARLDVGSLDRQALIAALGVNYHELAHSMFTPDLHSPLANYVREAGAWSAFNILEDQRAESFFAAEFSNAKHFFHALTLRFLMASEEQWESNYVLVYGRRFLPAEVIERFRDRFRKPELLSDFESVIDAYRALPLTERPLFNRGAGKEARDAVMEFHRLLNELRGVTGKGLNPSSGHSEDGDPSKPGSGITQRSRPISRRKLDELSGEVDEEEAPTLDDIAPADVEEEEPEDTEEDTEADGEAADGESTEEAEGETEGDGEQAASDEAGEGDPEEGSSLPGGDEGDASEGEDGEEGEGGTGDGEPADSEASGSSEGEGDGSGGEGEGSSSGEAGGAGDGLTDGNDGAEAESAEDGSGGSGAGSGSAIDSNAPLGELLRELAEHLAEEEEVREEVEDAQRTARAASTGVYKPESPKAEPAGHQPVTLDNLTLIRKVTKELREARVGAETVLKRDERSGRLDPLAWAKAQARPGMFDFYEEWDAGLVGEEGEMEVAILCDFSGSMRHVMPSACLALYVLKRAFEDVGDTKVTSWGYEFDSKLLFSRDEQAPRDSYPVYHANGGTKPGTALVDALKMLGTSRAGMRILLIITDGNWNDGYSRGLQERTPYEHYGARDCERLIQQANEDGIVTVLVGLKEAVKEYGSHACSISRDIYSPNVLPEFAATIASELVKRAAKDARH